MIRAGSVVLIGALVAWAGRPEIAVAYALAARLAYMGYAWQVLRREDAGRGRGSAEDRFHRFRKWKACLSYHDGLALVLLSWITRGTWGFHPAQVAAGAALVALGVWIKTWAVASLGWRSFYWYDFFVPPATPDPCRRGPYRFLESPMYTLGYAHAYGVPLLLGSAPGLLAGCFYHLAILALNHFVERPHAARIYAGFAGRAA